MFYNGTGPAPATCPAKMISPKGAGRTTQPRSTCCGAALKPRPQDLKQVLRIDLPRDVQRSTAPVRPRRTRGAPRVCGSPLARRAARLRHPTDRRFLTQVGRCRFYGRALDAHLGLDMHIFCWAGECSDPPGCEAAIPTKPNGMPLRRSISVSVRSAPSAQLTRRHRP